MVRSLALLTVLMCSVAAQAETYHGFLYAKLQAIGSRSEGPAYFLQGFDGRDVPIVKHGMMWQQDPVLQRFVGTKVTIEGDMLGEALTYRSIKPYSASLENFGN